MGKKFTQEEYVDKIYQRYGKEYSIIGNYINANSNILVKHNICGTEFNVCANSFLKGCVGCPCTRRKNNLVGEKFGKLTVLKECKERKNGAVMWECICECGNKITTYGNNLKNGHTISCGCYRKEKASNMFSVDISGNVYGRLTVIRRTNNYISSNGNSNTKWLCKCTCGNYIEVQQSGLVSGNTKSCGCYKKEIAFDNYGIDLTGKIFGKLTVLNKSQLEHITNSNKKVIYWDCVCECGMKKTVSGYNLKSGHTISCGCINSKNEVKLANIIKQYDYDIVPQYSFDDCKYKKKLRYDFGLLKFGEIKMLIEYDGEGHYKPIPRGNMTSKDAENDLKNIQNRDKIKTTYAKINNIPLLRIPYWEQSNMENIIDNFINKNAPN